MIRIKNLRGGWLFIPDAGLKLRAGQVTSVENLTPQIERLIDKGYVALVDTPSQKEERREEPPSVLEEKSTQSTKAETKPDGKESDFTQVIAGYRALNPRESVKFIKKCENLPLLRAILKKEFRETVKEAIDQRLKELE